MGVRHPAGTAHSFENSSITDMATGRESRGDTRHYENDYVYDKTNRHFDCFRVRIFMRDGESAELG